MNKSSFVQYPLWAFTALCIIISSCGKDPQPATAKEIDPSTLDFKRTENTVYLNMPAEPNSLNPMLTTQAYARYVHEQIFQTLTDKHPTTFVEVPKLASLPKVFERPDGGVDYTYDIHPDAKWPNGLPVTAADVIFTLKVLFNPLVSAGPYRPFYSTLENVTLMPANEKRVKFETSRPYLLSEAALGSLQIYPEYAFDPDGLMRTIRLKDLLNTNRAEQMATSNENLIAFAEQFNSAEWGRDPDKIVGSGPYQLVSWEAGQQIRLEKRADYWANDQTESWMAAGPDALVYQFIKEGVTMANALRDQSLDATVEMEVSRFKELQEEESTQQYFDFYTTDGFKYYSLFLNSEDPMLTDKRTRRALAHLVDVDNIIENYYGGLAKRVVGPILPQKSYYNNDLPLIEYSPEKARELLTAAGWTDSNGNGTIDQEIDGERVEMELKISAFPTEISQAIALLTQESAKEVGINIEILSQDPRTLITSLSTGEYQIATMGAGTDPNPDDMTQVWSTKSIPPQGTNRTRFGNAASDKIINRIRTTLDDAERNQLYQEIQQIIYDEQPMIFLFSPQERVVISKRFKGSPTPLTPGFEVNSFIQQDWNKKETE
ncbi:MAG: ABC transporter substrate-binding protein [Bacteroidota bacterium]